MPLFNRLSALVVTGLCVLLLTPVADAAPKIRFADGIAGNYVSDSWITAKVKLSLFRDPNVKAGEVKVETDSGVVQLSGSVSSGVAMNRACRLTQTIKGVGAVDNGMRLRSVAGPAYPSVLNFARHAR